MGHYRESGLTMSRTYEITGTYGSRKTPTTIYCYTDRTGATWYACEGSRNVNATYQEVEEGVDIEILADHDTMTVGNPIESCDDLEREVEE